VSFRYQAAINKPGFNPLGVQTTTTLYNLYSWGANPYGGLGLGNTTYYSSPMQVGSLTNWLQLSASYGTSMAIKTDGTLWGWGYNNYGQLGLGNTTNYSSPKQVGALTAWSKVSTGTYLSNQPLTAAIKTDGTLWTWGRNFYGGLGLGNTTNYSSPKQVGSLTNWSNVYSGGNWVMALKTDGTLWSWGANGFGNLGLGNTTNYSSPNQVGALTNWAFISVPCVNSIFVLAVKTNGTLFSWGGNPQGNLGLNNLTYYSSPKQIGALTTWAKCANGGNYFALAVKTDGTLWSWGANGQGQLGLNSLAYKSSPNQVGSLTNWNLVFCGDSFSSAIKTDGTLWTWGQNNQGQLGFGNTTPYSSPKQLGSSTAWQTVGAGKITMLALG